MKKLGLLFAGLLAVLSLSVAGAVKFTDVPPGHWAEEAVYKLADQGIILGFPDGTFRGNEYLTRYQAALLIYRLLERLRSEMKAGVDQETLTALRNALQELAAEVASLGVRVSALEDNAVTKADLKKALAGAGKGGMDMAAVKELKAQVEALAADLAALKTKVDANADSVKALNELAVLLNQDVLSLQDRVATLEKMMTGAPKGKGTPATGADLKALTEYVQALSGDVASLAGKVKGLEGDVATLKRNAFTISGSLGLTYKSVQASGFAGYDIDRFIEDSAFSAGDTDSPANNQVVDDAEGLSTTPAPQTTASFSVKFQTAKLTGTSKGEGVNTYEDLFQFSLKASAWSSISNGGSATNLNLYIDSVKTTLTVAKDQQLELAFGQSVNAKFTEYVFDNDANSYGHGIVAKLKGLPLGATITGVYGNNGLPGSDLFYGAHVAVSPMKNFSLGASYVAQDSFANPVYGFDADLGLGPISLMGEYFTDATGATSYYAKASTQFGAFSLGASYRDIAATVTPANMAANDLFTSKNNAPFAADQRGFGVNLGASFGLFGLKGEYQQYDLPIGTPHTYMKGSLSVGTDKKEDDKRLATGLAGFYLSAYYADVDSGACGVAGYKPGQTLDSGYNATLKHFGDAPDAMVKGLAFTVAYNGGSCTNDLAVYGQYDAKFGPISATLIGRYYNDMLASTTTTKYGVKVETDPFALPFKPSLMGGYVARSTTGGLAETKWFAGVKFAEFLFAPHSTFKAQYGSYSSTGLSLAPAGTDKDKAFDPATNYLYTTTAGTGGTLTGFELSWTYWDLTASFGSYVDNAGNYADAFKIAYTVNF